MKKYKRTKYTCYFAYLSMASVFSLPPLLFVTFHEMYGISYTLLGTLLLVNFTTQLCIDLAFTFFTKLFNIKLSIRIMPLLTAAGMLIYALVPLFAPEKAFAGFVVGTVIFSVSAGLSEVLLSPLVASLPSDNPEKDMSMLHSLYGWGVVTVIGISSLYFKLFGTDKWIYLAVFWAVLPIITSLLFWLSPIPPMNLSDENTKIGGGNFKTILLCAVCIFLGSAAENVMTSWVSSFVEKALLIPKAVGDILGMAVFALLLATIRNIYAKHGKNIYKTLIAGMGCAFVLYMIAGLSPNIYVAFIACICMGLCTGMLWPGTLILLEERAPNPGVAAYALMAACGDLGAAIVPQGIGIVVDKIPDLSVAVNIMNKTGLAADQIGLKCAMLFAAVFPLLGFIWLIINKNSGKKSSLK